MNATRARYNAVIYVPYQLERLLDFGFLVCLDSFLVSPPTWTMGTLAKVLADCIAKY